MKAFNIRKRKISVFSRQETQFHSQRESEVDDHMSQQEGRLTPLKCVSCASEGL